MDDICHSCGAPVTGASGRCQKCGGATTRRYITNGAPGPHGEGPPQFEIMLPCTIPEARYIAGEVWTHGTLYMTDLGIFFLAEGDGPWTPDRILEIAQSDPSKPYGVGPASHFLPLNHIVRFQHSRLTSYAVFTRGGRIPLRLTGDGWRLIDAFAAKMGISST